MNVDAVPHPRHLLPQHVQLNISLKRPVSREYLKNAFNYAVEDYFEKSEMARKLWHDHAEGIIGDKEWVNLTLGAIQSHFNDMMGGSNE